MNNLIWFRNDLRVADNLALIEACKGDNLLAVYCLDPRHYAVYKHGMYKTERFRVQFLIETLTDLKKQLEKLNISLFVYNEKPEIVIPELVKKHNITTIYSQQEWTKEEVDVNNNLITKLPASIAFETSYGQFLFHPDAIPYDSFQQIPEVFTQFRKKCEKYSKISAPLAIPKAKNATNLIENKTVIPNLKQLGLNPVALDTRAAFVFKGGEQEALNRLQNYFWETNNLASYKKIRNGLIGEAYSSKLSPWLANGSISARTIYSEIKRFEKEVIKNQDTYWLIFELIWRDYFKYISLKHKDAIFKLGGILDKQYSWGRSAEAFNSWVHGTTKEPFVNANMLELATTGWMSNRGRQNVASFWAKELEQDWRVGAAYFESMLIDYDVHSNWGNWMYNSGVGNDPRDRKFNIQRQAAMYDASGAFQNMWLQKTLF